jgi:molecular chaperone GrpE
MENNQNKKPLRQAANAAKDIYNTYVKNTDRKIPIESEDERLEDLEEKISAAFADDLELEEDLVEKEENPQNDESEDFEIDNNSDSDIVAKLNSEIAYYKEHLARKVAEMENMRNRMEKEKQDLISYANEKLLNNFLEIPDTIKQAISASEKTNDIESIKKGVELIYQKTIKLFENAKVNKMEIEIGEEFNVDFHDALMQSPNDEIPEGHIIQVLQEGYLLGEKVLRHAKVITSSGSAE